ncbi:MAG TPA: hypothetical protein VF522_16590 [Ramlibacter sp.]|uniref:hypothetical protein n=1 Tax=Ramlibacter sp. TaxID=1917967 RepID=UPI002ED32DA0
MKRLFVGLVLLMMSFLSALDSLEVLRQFGTRVGLFRWVGELLIALAAVALFAHSTKLHRRLLFPRRGGHLLAAGIVVYALGAAVATGLVVTALGWFAIEKDSLLAPAPALVAQIVPLPLLFAGQLLLVIGVFRAMTNLVPKSEFDADY